jgi:hypothetical protein
VAVSVATNSETASAASKRVNTFAANAWSGKLANADSNAAKHIVCCREDQEKEKEENNT